MRVASVLLPGLLGLLALTANPARAQDAPWWAGIDTLPPGVSVTTVDSVYAFSATSEEAIGQALERLGPESGDRTFHGRHFSRWRYRYALARNEEGGCTIDTVRIRLRSVIVMPRLRNVGRVGPELRTRWRRYTEALRRHEEGHRHIARQAMDRMWEDFMAVPPGPCDGFGAVLESIQSDAGDRLDRAQAAYDRETDHGRTEGATWPPGGDP